MNCTAKESTRAREAFLEHLGTIQPKQGSLKLDEDYQAKISKIVQTEIVPARTFKNKMDAIRDTLFGNLAKGVVGALGPPAWDRSDFHCSVLSPGPIFWHSQVRQRHTPRGLLSIPSSRNALPPENARFLTSSIWIEERHISFASQDL